MKHGADRPNIFYRNNESSASIGAGNIRIYIDELPVSIDAISTTINGDVPPASLQTNNVGMIVQDLPTSIGARNTEINADDPPASQGVGNSGINSLGDTGIFKTSGADRMNGVAGFFLCQ